MSRPDWREALAGARLQWQGSGRLRIGVWAIVAILWIYALLLANDGVEALKKSNLVLQDEVDRLRPLTRAQGWPARADEARAALLALQSMQWGEVVPASGRSDVALVEAAFQDWVRATAAKAGLRIREMSLTRAAAVAAATTSPGQAAKPESNAAQQVVRLRMTAEFGRTEVLVFLAEAARSERAVVVERLLLRPAAAASLVEMDLRAVVRADIDPTAALPRER